jgi:dCMP deaminase
VTDDSFEILSSAGNRTRQLKWDRRFLEMAALVGSWSKDPSTKVGAVIVRPDRTVLSVGFNGFPRALTDLPSFYADRDIKLSRVIHAEMNAIMTAGESVRGCTLYLSEFLPCDRCAAHMIQAGITRIVALEPTEAQEERWGDSMFAARVMFREAQVQVLELPR